MLNSFLSQDELMCLGFNSLGNNVLISRNATFYKTENISIGDNVRIDDFCVLSGGKGIKLGSYIHIACFSAIYGEGEVILDDFAGLSSRAVIYSVSDDFSGSSLTNPTIPDEFKPKLKKGLVHIKKHSIIGTGVTIMPNIILEEGCAVGAHSFVDKSCLPWSVYFGCPAKKIMNRKKDIQKLEKQFIQKTNSNNFQV